MKEYKAIIFDYGGVIHLVPENQGNDIFKVICDALELDIEEFKTLYFANNYRNNLQDWSHKQTLLYVIELLAKPAIDKEEADKIIEEFLRRRSINQELLGYITRIKALGYTVALLSNYNSALRTAIAENGVDQLFGENVFISTEIGCQKPDPKIFEHTFTTLGVSPEEVIFIDDSPMSLSTAESVGYHPICFRDNKQLKADLQALSIPL